LIEVIETLKKAGVRDQLEVFVDGGVRRGSDIFKAIALGADGVGLGRSFLYSIAGYGQAGMKVWRTYNRRR
jgi:L-lactate dehydrogenase (cytochrome)